LLFAHGSRDGNVPTSRYSSKEMLGMTENGNKTPTDIVTPVEEVVEKPEDAEGDGPKPGSAQEIDAPGKPTDDDPDDLDLDDDISGSDEELDGGCFGYFILGAIVLISYLFYKMGIEKMDKFWLSHSLLQNEPMRLVSHIFAHADWNHFKGNMIALVLVSLPLIAGRGPWVFLGTFLGGGVVSGLVCVAAWAETGPLLGASGGLYAVVACAAVAVPFGPGPVRDDSRTGIPWVLAMCIFIAVALPSFTDSGLVSLQGDPETGRRINHFAHWIGLLWGFAVPTVFISRAFAFSSVLFGIQMFLGAKMAPALKSVLVRVKSGAWPAGSSHRGSSAVFIAAVYLGLFLALAGLMWLVAAYAGKADEDTESVDDDEEDDTSGEASDNAKGTEANGAGPSDPK
jgi:membrane associated rhomboid family serine protease